MKFFTAFFVCFLLISNYASAKSLFNLTVDVDGTVVSESFDEIDDIVGAFTSANLSSLTGVYTDRSIASGVLDIRGIDVVLRFPTSATDLTFDVPVLGVSERFVGITRDESRELFEEFLKSNGNDILKRILQYQAANTPIDPVAGNPNSLMSTMGTGDFSMGTEFSGSELPNSYYSKDSTDRLSGRAGIGFDIGAYKAGDYSQTVVSLPLQYTIFLDDPGYQIKFDLPLKYLDTEGGATYSASLGVGFRIPINEDWSVTPAIRFGAVGSRDLGSGAGVYSGSLTTNYNYYWDDLKFTFGLIGAVYKTTSLSISDYELDYDMLNYMLKYGAGVEGSVDMTWFGLPTSWQVNFSGTNFFGDDLYIDTFFDLAASIGTRAVSKGDWSSLRVGITLTAAEQFTGARLNFGYKF